MNTINSIFIGFDSSNYGQQLAHDVCKRSIQKINKTIKINTLVKRELEIKKIYKRSDNTGATEFTYTRFLVPYLCGYKGWALFCDSDFLWLKDPSEIIMNYDKNIAVYCVQHNYTQCNGKLKMDGQQQEWYPRKNWSSLMLFNCEHPSIIINLTPENINTKSPSWLHRMEWCDDNMIGNIDIKYNYLVDYYNDMEINDIGALHFTDGGPWHPLYRNVTYGDIWLEYLTEEEKLIINHGSA
jgi:hypothetical protein